MTILEFVTEKGFDLGSRLRSVSHALCYLQEENAGAAPICTASSLLPPSVAITKQQTEQGLSEYRQCKSSEVPDILFYKSNKPRS